MMTVADSPLARPRADAVASAIKMHYTQHMAVMPHISCRDKNTIGLRAQFLGMQMNDIRHALIVTGDPIARGDRESIKSVFNFNSIKLMQYLQTMNREVFKEKPIYYGGALNQHNGSIENIANRMKQKMAAGAAWFLTQPVYGQTDIDRIHELKEKSGGRILVGIMPLVSRKNALFIRNEMPGIRVPDEVLERYQEGMSREEYEAVAIDISLDLMRRLGDDCDGYYLMTPFNRVSLIEKIIMRAKKELT
jgi:homocysteine S-methyltransferase